MVDQKAIDEQAKKLAQLVIGFRRGKYAKDMNWWNSNSPRSLFMETFGYEKQLPIFEQVVQNILKLNPEMLSEHYVERELTYKFLEQQNIDYLKDQWLNNEPLLEEAKSHIEQLVGFSQWQNVYIPIAYLWFDGTDCRLGKVTFTGISEEELERWTSQHVLWDESAPDVHVVAHVYAPGDQNKALTYARNKLDQALDIIRAFCFPFGKLSDTWKTGVLGDIISSTSTPMRINSDRFVTHIGSSTAQIYLKQHIFSKLEPILGLIEAFLEKPELSKMEIKLNNAVHWLSESTKPDSTNSKFAKIGFALESLLGGEAEGKDLKVRGITAMLAERASFFADNDTDDRLAIDKDIRKYYGRRSDIVHGGEGEVSLEEIDNFGNLIRKLVITVLIRLSENEDELRNVDDLEKWIKKQRYTLPENTEIEEVAPHVSNKS